jgi:hypothetical protein
MSTLNLYPYYEKLVREKKKYATIRLGDQRSKYRIGQRVNLTLGWENNNEKRLIDRVEITSVHFKRIKNIVKSDLKGESPDCLNKCAIQYVLSAIYRKIVSEEDYVTIIKWKYLKNGI